MWKDYYNVVSVDETLRILAEQGDRARIIAGATDLILEIERGVRKGIDTLIDVTRIKDLDQIVLDENNIIHIGPLVTHGQCAASKLIIEQAFPLAKAGLEVGAPQIRNRGTVAGNLITASPANDTITPLMALDTKVVLRSTQGQREIPLNEFYTGVRRNIMHPDEMMVDINFPALRTNQRGTFYKLGLRRAQAISVVNSAIVLTLNNNRVTDSVITLGSVAPVIIYASEAEAFLKDKILNDDAIEKAADLAKLAALPIDDIRGSKEYRLEMVRVCILRSLRSLLDGEERFGYPARPVLLRAKTDLRLSPPDLHNRFQQNIHYMHGQSKPEIDTRINGKSYTFKTGQHKTLLHLLREEAGLIGTKEGCAEGECGACTVFMDGMAVMSCLVPATRAHGAEIVTIEGIAQNGQLHPVQQAFIDKGAVQCGYCTPGFIMSSVMLLNEVYKPTQEEIKQAVSGNLCRCTGYYSIISAIEQAAQQVQ